MLARQVRLEGPLVIQNAESLQAQVLQALDEADSVRVDTSGATEIDVSFLQILIAAQRLAASERKSLRLDMDGAQLLADRAARCGIELSLLSPSN